MQELSETISGLEKTSNTLRFLVVGIPLLLSCLMIWRTSVERRLEKAKKQLAEGKDALSSEQAKQLQAAKDQLLELQTYSADRIIPSEADFPHSLDGLRAFTGTPIIIEHAKEDDPKEVARQLSDAVRSAGWEIIGSIPRTMDIKPGVYVQASVAPPPDPAAEPGQDPDYCKHQQSRKAANALIQVLAGDNKWSGVNTNDQVGLYVPPEDRLPAGVVRVLIGIKRSKPQYNNSSGPGNAAARKRGG